MLVGRVFLAVVSPVELAFEGVARLLGVPWVFNLVHALPGGLDRLAKPMLFGLVLVVWTGVAWWLARRAWPWLRRAGRPLLVTVATVLGAVVPGLILLPAQGLGWFGTAPANLAWDPLPLHGLAALSGLLFGLVATGGRPSGVHSGTSRRDALSLLVRSFVGIVAAAGVAGRWSVALAQQALELFRRVVGLSPRITPTPDHYVVSKNLFDPSVDEGGWSLRLHGLVDTPIELRMSDLQALPSVTRPSTLTCVSNQVGGDLIGTSEWTGVRLADLLAMAGPRADANELLLRAADNYSDSFPLEAALREGTIVAYLQNGEPLTRAHGFPARVLVPGIYGMKNVKWVVEIELTDEDHQGYWQTRGWSDVATVKTMSRIDTDTATRLDDGRALVGGIAFAGLRRIEAVEVSLDDGASWLPTQLESAPNQLSWVRWLAVLEVPASQVELTVRAVEIGGVVQTDVRSRPLPDGADGLHRMRVNLPG